jgi:HSP20 family protein
MDIKVDIKKLNPWNWLRHEEEQGRPVPVRRGLSQSSLSQLHKDIDRMFGNMLPGVGWGRMIDEDDMLLHPSVDVASTDKEYSITIEIPGVDENDTKLELTEDGQLIISGEKKQEAEQKAKTFYCLERSYGFFRRTISLPEDANHENIDASFKNGVLTVTCQRKAVPEATAKRIQIN